MNLVKLIAGGSVAALVLIYLLAGMTHVNPGEVTILIKNLGDEKGMQEDGILTGTHWVEPFAYDVVTYDTRQRQMEEVKDLPAGTGDGQPVLVDFSLQLSLDPTKVPALHERIGPGFYDRVVHPALIKTVKDKVPSQSSDVVYTTKGREAIERAINEELSSRFGADGILAEVNLKDVKFTNADYIKVLEAKAKAAQQVEVETRQAQAAVQTSIKVANIAEGEKQKVIKEAEAQRERSKLEGEGARLKSEESAKGLLAIATAEAQGTRLRREALSGAGGQELVSIEWAKNLGPNVKVYAVPTGAPGTTSLMDLNGIMQGALTGAHK